MDENPDACPVDTDRIEVLVTRNGKRYSCVLLTDNIRHDEWRLACAARSAARVLLEFFNAADG